MSKGKIVRFNKVSVILPIDVKVKRTVSENLCEVSMYVDINKETKFTVPFDKRQRVALVRNNLGVEIYSGE